MRAFLDRRQAADYPTNERGLKVSWRTLQKLATVGGGPPYRIFASRAINEPGHWTNGPIGNKRHRHSTSEAKRRPRKKALQEQLPIAE